MIQILPYGDAALIVKAGEDISPYTNGIIRKLMVLFDGLKMEGLLELVPSYNEIMVCFDPLLADRNKVVEKIKSLEPFLSAVELPAGKEIEIPVYYGGKWGPDLAYVAAINGLTTKEVVGIHSSVDYLVYMLGFTPGFCYLGGLDDRIATPRKSNPRLVVAAGSVGIAGRQTGVYPVQSPGGWQIIGRTNVQLFDPHREPVFLVNPGDKIRFVPVTDH